MLTSLEQGKGKFQQSPALIISARLGFGLKLLRVIFTHFWAMAVLELSPTQGHVEGKLAITICAGYPKVLPVQLGTMVQAPADLP